MENKDDFYRFRTVAGMVISNIKQEQIMELKELLTKNQNPGCGGTLDDDPEREEKWTAMRNCLDALEDFVKTFMDIQEIVYRK